MKRLLVPLLLATHLGACAGGLSTGTLRGPTGTLRICGKPAEGSLEIDETRVGPLGMFCEKGVVLAPGTHRVVATAAHHLPEYSLVEVSAGQVVTVEIELREVPL